MSKSQTAQVVSRVRDSWGFEVPRPRNLTLYRVAPGADIMDGPGMRILAVGGAYIPFLTDSGLLGRFPGVVVDAGAIRFVCNGADIMRPGVVSHGRFSRGRMVHVAEPGRRYLAVGEAAVDSEDMDDMGRGVVAKNLHYISDKYWEAAKNIR